MSENIKVLGELLRSENVFRKTKLRICKTVLRPTATYASEVWTLNMAQRNRIRARMREVPRKICGGKSVNRMWTRRTNQEVGELYGEPDTVIKSQRLRWLGHVERMPEDRLPKMVWQETIGGRRRGSPRSRWWSEAGRDLGRARISGWRAKAASRGERRRTVDRATGLLGLSCNR